MSELRYKIIGSHAMKDTDPSECARCGDAEWGGVLIDDVCGECLTKEIAELRVALIERDALIESLQEQIDEILPTCPVCGDLYHITTDGVQVCRTCQSCDM